MKKFRDLLAKNKMRVTAQRLAVHEAMLELVHASADEVLSHIIGKGETSLKISTVYNILTEMCGLGLYQRRMSRDNKMYFDVNSFDHIHLYDNENDAFIDVMDSDLLQEIQARLWGRRFRGYRIEGLDIQIVVRPSSRRRRK